MNSLPPFTISSENWHCESCQVPLELVKAKVSYMGATFEIELPCCPSCGQFFVDKDLAEGKMREAEMLLEDK